MKVDESMTGESSLKAAVSEGERAQIRSLSQPAHEHKPAKHKVTHNGRHVVTGEQEQRYSKYGQTQMNEYPVCVCVSRASSLKRRCRSDRRTHPHPKGGAD